MPFARSSFGFMTVLVVPRKITSLTTGCAPSDTLKITSTCFFISFISALNDTSASKYPRDLYRFLMASTSILAIDSSYSCPCCSGFSFMTLMISLCSSPSLPSRLTLPVFICLVRIKVSFTPFSTISASTFIRENSRRE